MKLKLMIALVILALVFGMSFTACDDGDLPVIKPAEKDGVPTETILDIGLLGTDISSDDKDKGELQGGIPDTTQNVAPAFPF